METFASWKTMNKRRRQLSILAAAVAAAVLAAAGAVPARAQSQQQTSADRISVKLTDPSRPALVKASLVNGGITVKAYEGQEVIVEARARHEEPEREASGGLRRLNIARTGLTVEEDNNEVRISTDSYLRPIDLILTVPVRTSLKLGAVNDVNGSVTLNHVSGNCVAHALNGKVLATFVRVSPQKPMAFSSLNGDIDVTFPPDLKASVVIRSDRGDVFSDFDVQLQASAPQQTVEDSRGHGGKYRVRIDKSVRGTIHGGGPEYQFTNFQGSIYIRKGDAH